MEEKEQGKSKYSSGVNIIIRLDELWKKTHQYALEGRYKLLNIVLDRVWLELARDLGDKNSDEKKNFSSKEKEFEEFETQITNKGEIQDNNKAGFEEITQKEIETRNEHYKILMQKQRFLARLENELGKGTTQEDDDDDDID